MRRVFGKINSVFRPLKFPHFHYTSHVTTVSKTPSKKNFSQLFSHKNYSRNNIDIRYFSRSTINTRHKFSHEKSRFFSNDVFTKSSSGYYILTCFVAVLLFCLYRVIEYIKYFQQQKKRELEELQNDKRVENLSDIMKQLEEQISPDSVVDSFMNHSKFVQTILIAWRIVRLLTIFIPIIIAYPICVKTGTRFLTDFWYSWLLHGFLNSGPVMIKLGQWMSTRPDMFSPKLCDVFTMLHANGKVHSYSDSERVFFEEFGKKIGDVFDEFEKKTIGTGAIAQVHKAKLKSEYCEYSSRLKKNPYVAVKIRHPGIKSDLIKDLQVLQMCVKFLSKFKRYEWLELDKNILFFSKFLQSQLDLRVEAMNLIQFCNNFKEFEGIHFPHPIKTLISERVLVETFEEGETVQNFVKRCDEFDVLVRKRIAKLGVIIMLKMLISDNFFHADLHPGNILIRMEEGDNYVRPCYIFLDTGLVNNLPRKSRNLFAEVLKCTSMRNGGTVAKLLLADTKKFEKCFNHETKEFDFSLIKDKKDAKLVREFIDLMELLVEKVVDAPFGSIRVAPLFSEVLGYCRDCQICIDSNFLNSIISIIITEGIARSLYNEVKFLMVAKDVLVAERSARKEVMYQTFKPLLSKISKKNKK